MTDWKSNKRLSDSLARSLSRHTCDIHVVHGKAGSGNGKKHLCGAPVAFRQSDRPTDERPVRASADRFHFYGVRTQRAWRGVAWVSGERSRWWWRDRARFVHSSNNPPLPYVCVQCSMYDTWTWRGDTRMDDGQSRGFITVLSRSGPSEWI